MSRQNTNSRFTDNLTDDVQAAVNEELGKRRARMARSKRHSTSVIEEKRANASYASPPPITKTLTSTPAKLIPMKPKFTVKKAIHRSGTKSDYH